MELFLLAAGDLALRKKFCFLPVEQQNMKDMTEGGLGYPNSHLLFQRYQRV